MSPFLQSILAFNLVASLGVFYLAARHYVYPLIRTDNFEKIVRPILILNMLRHLGLMFLAPGVVLSELPAHFAWPAALGDCFSALLALLSWRALNQQSNHTRSWLWVFNTLGLLDMLMAIALSRWTQAAPYMGASYWIPAFWVPIIIISHWVLYKQLWITRRHLMG